MADGDFETLDQLDAASAADSADAAAFSSGTQPSAISFVTDLVQPASQPGVYVNVDDTIELLVTNSSSVVTTLTAQLRILLPDGTVQYSQLTISSVPDTYAPQSATLSQVEGFILSIVVGPVPAGVRRGECFVQVNVIRGADPTQLTTVALVAEYVSTGFLPNWPFGTPRSALEGRGVIQIPNIGGLSPSTTVQIVSPTIVRWRLISVLASFQTDATAGNRAIRFDISSGLGGSFSVAAPALQPPNTSQEYQWGAAMAFSVGATQVETGPLPMDLVVEGNSTFRCTATGTGAADHWGFLSLTVEEWIDI